MTEDAALLGEFSPLRRESVLEDISVAGLTLVLIIAFFATNQIALGKIISRAKWKTLNEIQAQIEKLRAQEDIPGEKTLEHLGKLMDYHDRIKATRGSALDVGASLRFLNSLLLPPAGLRAGES